MLTGFQEYMEGYQEKLARFGKKNWVKSLKLID
jgi:hypothetical protein